MEKNPHHKIRTKVCKISPSQKEKQRMNYSFKSGVSDVTNDLVINQINVWAEL